MHKKIVLTLIVVLCAVLCVLLYTLVSSRNNAQQIIATSESAELPSAIVTVDAEPRCLADDEVAEYRLVKNDKLNKENRFTTIVKNKQTGDTVYQFDTEIFDIHHYYPVELQQCGVYYLIGRNYERVQLKTYAGFESYIAKSDFSGRQSVVLKLEGNSTGFEQDYKSFYGRDFRVDPTEKYIALTQGYNGSEKNKDNPQEYALVIKSLKATSTDVFYLPYNKILADNPDLLGTIGFLEWSKDGRYYYATIFDGAYIQAWLKVDSTDWSYEIIEAPNRVLGGYPLNVETGWVPYIPDALWTGLDVMNEAMWDERKEEGKKAALSLFNIHTGEKRLIQKTDAPIWFGLGARWVSDDVLQYHLPSSRDAQTGATSTYSLGAGK